MNINNQHILPQGEGLKVEFKTTFNTEAIETLVAFVNAKGGVVYVGAKDNGEIVGVQFRRIRKYIEEYPTMETEFKEVPNGLLFTYSYTIQKNSTTPPYYTPEMLDNKENIEASKEKDLKKDLKKLLSITQQKIIVEIEKNNNITQKELSEKIGINEKNVRNNIAKLKKADVIQRIGPDKGGYWKIKNEIKL